MTGFDTTRRGYDRAQVDGALGAIAAELAELRTALQAERARADELAAKLDSSYAERHLLDPSGEAGQAEAGARVTQIFRLAEEEAREARERVVAGADAHREQATADAAAARDEAETYAREHRAEAVAEAAALREAARAEAVRVREEADAYAATHRADSDVAFERNRARAVLAMADFDTTMMARRDAAELAFTTRKQEAEADLIRSEQRRSELESEAEGLLEEARAQAGDIVAAAGAEADRVVAEARHTAERARKVSEQELTALAASRDAINAQLADLRRTLDAMQTASPVNAVLATDPRDGIETSPPTYEDDPASGDTDLDAAGASGTEPTEQIMLGGALDAMLGEPVDLTAPGEPRGVTRERR